MAVIKQSRKKLQLVSIVSKIPDKETIDHKQNNPQENRSE